jgi:hypothetical protein
MTAAGGEVSRITLRALEGEPLVHDRIREMVEATAQAIAERQGVKLMEMETEPDRITLTLRTGRIESIGFAAELRRLTTKWYTRKFGVQTLWGEPPPPLDEGEPGEEWKHV